LISRSLFVLLFAAAPAIVARQNSPVNDKQEGMVQAPMRNELTPPGAQLWKYLLSIPENCASRIAHEVVVPARCSNTI
jgi:hypothetical protein